MKEIRFRRPEFQGKLRRARKFERRQDEQPSRLTMIWPLAGLIFLALAAYFLFFSKVFVITASNNDQVNSALARISGERKFLIPKSHFAILTRGNLLIELQSANPEASPLRVRRGEGRLKSSPTAARSRSLSGAEYPIPGSSRFLINFRSSGPDR